ncbi:unnamed protein product [Rotaria sordida]|uniref:Aminopeptidase n=2 Tax=Rotaria sordida TaxID=392033 RepID=A0A814WA96_9BILA|nr:unnamed protein product [Rotaria sordida]
MMIHFRGTLMMIRTILFIGILLTFVNLVPRVTGINVTYASEMRIDDVMTHLNELQKIATASNGNRAVKTIGFNRTLDYITNYLKLNTNFNITKTYFYVRNFQLLRKPTFSSTINGIVKKYTYSTSLSSADFYYVQYSTSANINNNVNLTAIPNLGCSDADWLAARPPPAGIVALVKRGDCSFIEQATLASKYNVAALLFYNDGTASNRMQPIYISLGQNNRVPALFLSYNVGKSLATAANDPSKVTTVRLTIETDKDFNPVGNICADTLTGDPTQTIIICSHSDSVTAGPGINDDGSGIAATLALAATLSHLFQTSNYASYAYRVRFCWWGAEELGLLGSDFHVSEAKKSTIVGERIQDYLAIIDLDMIASPNFIFAIYDGKTAPTNTPAAAKPGSIQMTTLFQDWFIGNKFPWDYTTFDGRSDYGPFLAAGICAGGLFTGAEELKTVEQQKRYNDTLGTGFGGTANVALDNCYHKSCDTIANINKFALNKTVQATANVIERLGQQSNLKSWLYPTTQIQQLSKQTPQRKFEYNSINEYFGLPYN